MKFSWILYMSTFPPRECGIATFTKDLTTAMDKKFSPYIKSKILAMNSSQTSIYNYPMNVIFEVSDNDISSYIDVARWVNKIDAIKLINIQHEFGIFGGVYTNYLIAFLDIVEKPIVITFHTILPNPDDKLKKKVRNIAEKSTCLVIMTNKGNKILREDYEIKKKIIVIPHGIPTIPFNPSIKRKTIKGIKEKIILSSFGLMHSGKGYEYVIEALPKVVKKFPNLLYLIIGETHPEIRRKEGEKYRNFLEEKVKELGLQKYVKFYNRYLSLKEIIKFLRATDIYISSNQDPKQIVSGTLSYAMGCGRTVISTPFYHAREVVTPERGFLVKFKDSKLFADTIIKILSNPGLKERMERNLYSYTRHMTWPNVALSYMNLFAQCISEFKRYNIVFPKIKLTHITNLTDDFGILQFANYANPDKLSGYTLDDNARALLACAIHYNIFGDKNTLILLKKYLNFIKFVQQNDNKMYNFVDHNRQLKLEYWSDDAHGRAMWALGYLISSDNIPMELRRMAEIIFVKGIKAIDKFKSPRAIAFIIIGLYFYTKVKKLEKIKIRMLSDKLIELYEDKARKDWKWFENYLTYSNSKLPEALFYSYKITRKEKYLTIAKESLDFLISITLKNNVFVPIGQKAWYIKDDRRSHFDQQPIEAASMVQTLTIAYEITLKEKYMKFAGITFQWFLGKNSLNQVVYDENTGGCHDGIGEFSINLNQGTESSLAYLLARLTFEVNRKKNYRKI